MPELENDGRQDVLLLKQQLAEALGENGPAYWQALTDFVCGKLNRQEFDFYANLYLSRENAPLHNKFILANIHNAQKDAPPPRSRSVGWAKGKKGKDGKPLDKEKDPKQRKVKNQVLSLSKAERERIKTLKSKGKDTTGFKTKLKEHRILKGAQPPFPQPSALAEYNRGLNTPLCFDSKEIPDFESLRDRMTAVAYENGLFGGVHDDSVELMLHALETHIKNVISNCIIKLRTNRALGISIPKKDIRNMPGGANCDMERRESHSGVVSTLSHYIPPSAPTPVPTSTSTSATPAPSTTPHTSHVGLGPSSSSSTGTRLAVPNDPSSSSLTNVSHGSGSGGSGNNATNSNKQQGGSTPTTTNITAKDLAFTIEISPSMLVENPVNVEKLRSILEESESEEDDDGEEDEDYDMSDNPMDFL
ncbi:hypothetical protein DFQ27_009496 [Actinomortierella ambigua]|uniref:Transcriptional coactivator HFI1/ADA1 n=1 Tax=Actinomortierella ambigua TaxID=1343610 RepID=A0A9P6TXI4_9FUNG|nr:hypothetical protein DFQ27_009496 [Actinomortierella ambigua]